MQRVKGLQVSYPNEILQVDGVHVHQGEAYASVGWQIRTGRKKRRKLLVTWADSQAVCPRQIREQTRSTSRDELPSAEVGGNCRKGSGLEILQRTRGEGSARKRPSYVNTKET